jgi:hypothetical protein
MQKTKGSKITYSTPNLSALAVANVARALKSDVTISKLAKPNEKADVFNVELKVAGSSALYGELTVTNYLTNVANQDQKVKYLCQGCSNLNFDDLLYMLNHRLRPAADAFAITAKNSEPAKDTIKAVAKELEEANVM